MMSELEALQLPLLIIFVVLFLIALYQINKMKGIIDDLEHQVTIKELLHEE